MSAWGLSDDPPITSAAAAATGPAPRRLGLLGDLVIGALALSLLANLAGVVTDVDRVQLLDQLIAGKDVAARTVSANDDRYSAVVFVELLLFVVTAVVWCVWFRRAYVNVERVSSGMQRFGTGWSTGAWFTPFLNLWRPKQIANDIWRSGELDPDPTVPFSQRHVPTWLHLWWVAWLVSNFAARAAGFGDEKGLSAKRTAASASIFADTMTVVAAAFAMVVVLRMTRRQDAVADTLARS